MTLKCAVPPAASEPRGVLPTSHAVLSLQCVRAEVRGLSATLVLPTLALDSLLRRTARTLWIAYCEAVLDVILNVQTIGVMYTVRLLPRAIRKCCCRAHGW